MRNYHTTSMFDHLTPGVKSLLIANGVIFLAQMAFPNVLLKFFALTPIFVLKKYWLWQLMTYAFLHGNWLHLFVNMLSLWFLGPHVESYWGTARFLRYYLLCVLGAAFTQVAIAPFETVVGASGGLYGILLAFGFLFPDTVLYLYFLFPLRAIQAVFLFAVLSLLSAMGSGGSRVAHLAHMGGLLTGFLYFKLPLWTREVRGFRFRKPRLHVVRHPGPSTDADLTGEVNRILDKISLKGVGSLTDQEHDIMRRYASRRQ
ncbi:MAG: rhomboid family intramembrane serine protease [Elusimicrobia bacterium]|nr:rhomboid family intramembrane serine protease [Candidatus Obscuribacterium magneticum]